MERTADTKTGVTAVPLVVVAELCLVHLRQGRAVVRGLLLVNMQDDTARVVVHLPGDVVSVRHHLPGGREKGEGVVLRIQGLLLQDIRLLLFVGGAGAGVSVTHDIGHEEEKIRESIGKLQDLGLVLGRPI